ncbi:helix-turn-helix domain-containing protein [Kitasatospora aureofaciens]|uniref:helix-turn-helix domain-containing protein n=1 Tax=Kitasatospora aureofaciens TaxID=1894 RepID=UPI001C457577|nr:helix-turn-helix transcriptional regulator [Kitasatospora aureofaciens]MBV6698633.1 helix-turn-helix domain-containing protein [Kitasatospora aureofaciens]
MGYKGPISQRQRRFGEELQRLRTAAGLSSAEAGALVGMKVPAVSHTEAGRITLNPERLEVWLDAYGCTDPSYRKVLAEMGQSTGKGWWSEFEGRVPALALDLAEAEDRADSFSVFDTLYVPGSLQLPGYTEAIYKDAYQDGRWDEATAVQFRMDRQRILTDDKRRRFHFVIHEAALRMRFAGTSVMRDQLLHLIEMAELPNVTIQIMPFDAPGRVPYSGAFLICNPGCTDLSTIILDGPKRAIHLGDPVDVVAYHQKFQEASDLALPAVDSAKSRRDSPFRDSWGLLQHLIYLLQT